MTLLAFAWSSPRLSATVLSYFCASWDSTAAGRACRPVGFGMTTASEVTVRPAGAGTPSAVDPSPQPPPNAASAMSSTPAVTRPARGVNEVSRFELAITIWVSRLLAPVATLSRSKLISSSPVRTRSPTLTLGSKPSPRILTVSRPMWSSTSRSPRVRIVTACAAGCRWMTSPSHGARRWSLRGSIETPSPTIFCAKTGSGTCSIGTMTPVSGAFRARRVTAGAEASVVMGGPPWVHRRSVRQSTCVDQVRC